MTDTAGSRPPGVSSSGSQDGDFLGIERYRIVRRLGQRGLGRVYLAHNDEPDRPVVIEVPNPDRIEQPSDVEEFLVEARMLPRLDRAGSITSRYHGDATDMLPLYARYLPAVANIPGHAVNCSPMIWVCSIGWATWPNGRATRSASRGRADMDLSAI